MKQYKINRLDGAYYKIQIVLPEKCVKNREIEDYLLNSCRTKDSFLEILTTCTFILNNMINFLKSFSGTEQDGIPIKILKVSLAITN